MATKKEMAKKNKKILKLKRLIAKVNGHEGYAFDADKITYSGYDSYTPVRGLEHARVMLPFFDFSIEQFFNFMLLVRTEKGCFGFPKHVMSVKHQTELITLTFNAGLALQKVAIHDFKIVAPSGVCMLRRSCSIIVPAGDEFNVHYHLRV